MPDNDEPVGSLVPKDLPHLLWTVVSPTSKFSAKALIPRVMVFGRWGLGEVCRFQRGQEGGAPMMVLVSW